MARISLRSYHQEIESLIESGQIDEAIAHCRYILKTYPKSIDTYRLLGKAFLESQRYGDAADVMQRVLSSAPEDFVAHLGMSIIREDEGHLDEAIWHMERAFEVQPANNVIQDELRRLYGRRDGFEPPKVRLNRGALARMYAKGDLYTQAIGELRAGLAEDPNRLDLQNLLGRVYFLAGQRVEAADTCSALLRKLPYCLEANSIMAEILTNSERANEAQAYRQRVQALDPYAAYLSAAAPTSAKVPENAVTLEKLSWRPGQTESGQPAGQPEWAASLGVNLGGMAPEKESMPEWLTAGANEPRPAQAAAAASTPTPNEEAPAPHMPWEAAQADEQTPDWLKGLGPASAPAAFGGEETPAAPTPEAAIPDWMKSAGWSPSSGAEEEPQGEAGAFDFSGEAAPGEGEELFAAEIPDWLRSMAPSEDLPAAENAVQGGQAQTPGDSQVPATGADLTPDWIQENATQNPPAEQAGPAQAGEFPAWMFAGDQEKPAEPSAPEEELPDWLRSLGSKEEALPAQVNPPQAEVGGEENIPDWLRSLKENEGGVGAVAGAAAGAAAGLAAGAVAGAAAGAKSGDMAQAEQAASSEAVPAASEEIPEWLREMAHAETQPVQAEAPRAGPAEAALETTPAVAAPAGPAPVEAAAAPKVEPEAVPTEEIPLWMREIAPAEFQPVQAEAAQAVPALAAAALESTPAVAEAAAQAAPAAAAAPEVAAPKVEPEAVPTEEIPLWMREIAPAEFQPVQAEAAQAEPALAAAAEPAPISEAQMEEAQPASEWTAGAETFDLNDAGAFAWLESLAVKQGASEALLLTPEQRQETPPDWVQKAAGEAAGAEAAAAGAVPAAAEEAAAGWAPEAALAGEPPATQQAETAAFEPGGLLGASGSTPAETEWIPESETGLQPDSALAGEETAAAETAPAEPTAPEQAAPAEEAATVAGPQAEIAVQPGDSGISGPNISLGELPLIEGDTKPVRVRTGAAPVPASAQETAAAQATAETPPGEPGLAPGEAALGAAAATAAAAAAAAVPAWLYGAGETAQPPVSETPAGEQPAPESAVSEQPPAAAADQVEAPAGAETFDLNDAGAFAWLESLAVKQGASEALLLTPEQRQETPPDWVQKAAGEAAGAETAPTTAEEGAPPAPEPAQDETPSWLKSISEPAAAAGLGAAAGATAFAAAENLPDWLKSTAEQEPGPASEAAPAEPAEPAPAAPAPAAQAAVTGPEAGETHAAEAEAESLQPAAAVEAPASPAQAETQPAETAQAGEAPASGPAPQALPAQPEPEGAIPDLPDWLQGAHAEPAEEEAWAPPQEAAVPAGPRLDLNQASMVELERLPGVGFIMAQQIVNHREQFGPFAAVEDLLKVPGFSESTLQDISSQLWVNAPPAERLAAVQEEAGAPLEEAITPTDVQTQTDLIRARNALVQGDLNTAVSDYGSLVKARQFLPDVIRDLQEALHRFPADLTILQTLGDAYMRNDQLQEALDAYTRAEELLR